MTAREQDATFEAWMQDHQGILFKVVNAYSQSPAEQDDLAQEIRLAVWRAVPTFDQGSKPSTYIYRIALNRAISWQRSRRSHQAKLDRYQASLPGPASASNPTKDPRLELLYTAIRRLNEAERALVLLHLDGHTYNEIADTLGITTSNAGVRLNRIKAKLTEYLKEIP